MNGKDADLDRIGQCLVKKLVTVDPTHADTMRVDIHLRLYASVCAPTMEGIDWVYLKENASPELKAYFKDFHEIDWEKLDFEEWDEYTENACEVIAEYFMEQATEIACGANPCPDECMAFMWDGDGSWDGGTDVVLSIPMTVDEYDEIEAGDQKTLDAIAARIAKEIYDANEGGTPERDKLKHFEEEVGLWNDMINRMECYAQ